MQNYICKALIKYSFIIGLFLIGAFTIGCERIEEKDLTDKWVEVIVPRDLLLSTNYTQHFIWEALDGAETYQLQIARPSFLDTEIEELIVDTTLKGTKYTHNFRPGKYEWRIRAHNSTSKTYYRKRLMKIDSARSISGANIILRSPGDNIWTNNVKPRFEWELLTGAKIYRYQIYKGTFGNGAPYTTEKALSENDKTTTLGIDLEEGNYHWGVRGEDDNSITVYSTRKLNVDTTSPNKPTLLAPGNNGTSGTGVIAFKWNVAIGNGAPETDTIEIYGDSLLTNLRYKANGVNKGFTSDTIPNGSYFWRVRRGDAAGNTGSYSSTRKVIVN